MSRKICLMLLLQVIGLFTGCAQNDVTRAAQTPPQMASPKLSDAAEKQPKFQTPSPITRSFQNSPHDAIEKIQLRWVDAAQLAEIIQNLFSITSMYESRTNTLILSGDSLKVKSALQLASDLDRDPIGEGGVFFIYPLKNATAIEMAALLQSLSDKGFFTDDDRHPKTNLLVAPDPRTNSLLISTTYKYETHLRDILKTLDKELPK